MKFEPYRVDSEIIYFGDKNSLKNDLQLAGFVLSTDNNDKLIIKIKKMSENTNYYLNLFHEKNLAYFADNGCYLAVFLVGAIVGGNFIAFICWIFICVNFFIRLFIIHH